MPHDHVIEDVDVIVADPLDGAGQPLDGLRPFAVRHARKLHRELHGVEAQSRESDTVVRCITRLRQASAKPWLRTKGPKLWRSGTEYCRVLSSDQP
jgi:hypothetical protein